MGLMCWPSLQVGDANKAVDSKVGMRSSIKQNVRTTQQEVDYRGKHWLRGGSAAGGGQVRKQREGETILPHYFVTHSTGEQLQETHRPAREQQRAGNCSRGRTRSSRRPGTVNG